ncbi:MAG: ABC transporter ATP-binding protein [bacterium]
MNNNLIIQAKNINKTYPLYVSNIDRLKETLNPFKKNYHDTFFALKNISLEVKKGETLAIIGQNGSGKSTLLKLICGILTPDDGDLYINGRISALLELGAGFNPDFTGRQNVYLNASILGFTDKEIDERFDDIVFFSEIGKFIDQPVKTYSTGMYLRLAFSVAVHVDPEILIIDEVLGVGDIRFQQKCLRRMETFKKNGTILFVSHDMGAVRSFCDRAVWLKDGQIYRQGSVDTIAEEYEIFMFYEEHLEVQNKNTIRSENVNQISDLDVHWQDLNNFECFGDFKARLVRGAFYKNNPFEPLITINNQQEAVLFMQIEANDDIDQSIIGFIIYDAYGNHITGSNTFIKNCHIPPFKKGRLYIIKISFTIPLLRNGKYSLSLAIASGTQENHIQHHWVHDAFCFEVANPAQIARQSWMFPISTLSVDFLNF